MKVTRRTKEIGQEDFFRLLDQFINDSYKGYRMRLNGKNIRKSTVTNYETLRKLLIDFTNETGFRIRLFLVNNLSKDENETARRYSHELYQCFSEYLYTKGCFDNYAGHVFTVLKTFYNYLINERNLNVGPFHRKFYVYKEEIPVIVLSPEQLNYLIHNKELNDKLTSGLQTIKDIFVFGCTVALRACDLLSLKEFNLIVEDEKYYLKVSALKTGAVSVIKLPDYAVEILKKYEKKFATLLPPVEMTYFNRQLKILARHITNNEPIIKTRTRRGMEVMIYKDPVNKIHYTMADHITTHTMRRTAITTMLRLGMAEQTVRKISGHSPSSKEFYKYVEYNQKYLDRETDLVFEKLMKSTEEIMIDS